MKADRDEHGEEKKHGEQAIPPNNAAAGPHYFDLPPAPPASLPTLPSASVCAAVGPDNANAAEGATRKGCDDASLDHAHNNVKPTQDYAPPPQHQPANANLLANGPSSTATSPGTKLKSAFRNASDRSGSGDPHHDVPNIARICGRSATSCGYCRGSRTWVLSVKEGSTEPNNAATESEVQAQPTQQAAPNDQVRDYTRSATKSRRNSEGEANQLDSAPGPTDQTMEGDGCDEDDNDGGNDQRMVDVDDADCSDAAETTPTDSSATASKSYGLIFPSLSPACYQQLLDTGWRRSGNHLYKPDNLASCCPALSIRLNAQQYRASRSQRRVGKRLGRYLSGGGVDGMRGRNIMARNGAPAKKSRGKKKAENASRTVVDDILAESNSFLESLPSETMAAVRSYVGPSGEQITSTLDEDEEVLTKLCTFKVLRSIPKNALKSINTERDSPDGIISAVSTSVCAAVGGRSKGKINADSLAKHVAEMLTKSKAKLVAEDEISVLGIQAEKGGRVSVYLLVSHKERKAANGDATSAMDVEGLDVGGTPTLRRQESQRVDVIADFLRKAQLEMPESYGQRQNQRQSCGEEASRSFPNAAGGSNSLPGNKSGPYLLTVQSVPSHISASQPEVHRLFAKYQTNIHGDKDPFASVAADLNPVVATKDDSCNENGDDDKDDLDAPLDDEEEADDGESTWQRDIYDVDKVYAHMNSRTRMRIRKGYVNFHRFLCETPLPLVQPDGSDDQRFQFDEEGYDIHIPFGSYHQQYRINGVLIAVGVVDVLPHCLSSVYAFYDPDLSRHLELGKYTALREIEWVKRACTHRRELVRYYLGYYIRSCIKMVYKAEYKPSELLCPTTSRWVDFETAKSILDENSPVRQSCTLFVSKAKEERYEERRSNPTSFRCDYTEQHKLALLDSIMLDIGNVGGKDSPPITASMLNSEGRAIVDPLIKEFINEVGFDVSRRCIIRLS